MRVINHDVIKATKYIPLSQHVPLQLFIVLYKINSESIHVCIHYINVAEQDF
jgi:hypothetical protein